MGKQASGWNQARKRKVERWRIIHRYSLTFLAATTYDAPFWGQSTMRPTSWASMKYCGHEDRITILTLVRHTGQDSPRLTMVKSTAIEYSEW